MDVAEEQLTIHISQDMLRPSAFKTLDGFFLMSELNAQYDVFKFNDPVKYEVTITNTGDAILLTGSVSAKAKTKCSRCLDDVELDIKGTIDAYYLIEAPQNSEENEINEFEILPDDHNIPLDEIIKATLVVDAPAKPLCSEECKGLCPKCGANLNKEKCKCDEEIDESNPFSILKDIKL